MMIEQKQYEILITTDKRNDMRFSNIHKQYNSLFTHSLLQLSTVFILYIFIILIFSVIYYFMYKFDENSFLISSDVMESKKYQLIKNYSNQLSSYRSRYRHLIHLKAHLSIELKSRSYSKKFFSISYGLITIATKRATYMFVNQSNTYPTGGGGVAYNQWVTLKITPKAVAKNSLTYSIPNAITRYIPDKHKEILQVVDNLISHHASMISQIKKNRDEIKIFTQNIFNYFDFLYFSTITQSTVGYGDILPNKTSIRMLVTLQVIISLFMVMFALNVAILKTSKK